MFWSLSLDLWEPVDTYYNDLWNITGEYGIQAEQAWDITRGNTAIKVGILENGVQADHDD